MTSKEALVKEGFLPAAVSHPRTSWCVPAVWLGIVVILASPAAADLGILPYDGPALAPNVNITTNINAADTVNADQLWTGGGLGLNLTGAGVTVGVWDGGYARTTHQELTGRVTVKDSGGGTEDHATHVTGTIGATGVVAAAHGMANQVNVWSYEWTNDTSEMAAAAATIVASNHSYSYSRGWTYTYTAGPNGTKNYGLWYANRYAYTEDPYFGKYDSTTRTLDQVLYSNPRLLSVWAASNDRNETRAYMDSYYLTQLVGGGYNGWYWVPVSDPTFPAPAADGSQAGGYDCLPQSQVAKNTLVVGAVNDVTVDPYTPADITMTSFSSWGPTDDGRIKPDVVANGYSLYSSAASSDSSYGSMSGTSMAAPNATGLAALLVQHYRNLHGGATPLSSTTKGLMIHTASEAGNVGPDYIYGWGLLNGAGAATFLTDAAAPEPTDSLFEQAYAGSAWDTLLYSDGSGPIKATVVWTDPAPTTLPGSGLDDATSTLVHDLDVLLYGPGGTPFYPWTLNPASPSTPAVRTQANHRDNVEQVLIDVPSAGWYAVTLSGGAYSQTFSLLVSGGDTALGPGAFWKHDPNAPGDWQTAGHWAPFLPRPTDTALIDNGGTAVISTGTVATQTVYAGHSLAGSLSQSGGTLVIGSALHVGASPGSTGAYALTGGLASVGGSVTLAGATGARGLLNLTGGSLTAAGPIVLASPSGGTAELRVSPDAYLQAGGLIIHAGSGQSTIVGLEMDPSGYSLIHTAAASTLDGTLDVQVDTLFRPHESDVFIVIASTDPSGVHFVGNFIAFTSNVTIGLLPGSDAFSGAADGADYELTFLGYTAGDANGDHWVDAGDLSLMGGAWSMTGQTWATGDFNGDGLVDAGDLSLLGSNWYWTLPTPSPGAPLPEPATLILLALSAVTLLRTRRR